MKNTALNKFLYHADEAGEIYCGDALKLIPLMEPGSIDLIVTDLPYDLRINYYGGGIANRENVKVFKSIKTGFKRDFDPREIVSKICWHNLLDKFNGYFWCNKRQVRDYLDIAINTGMIYDILTWHKNNPMPLTNRSLLPDTEYCVVMREKGATFNVGLPKDFYRKWWVTARMRTNGHPTPKPEGIMMHHVMISSKAGDIVLDPYCGSGTSLAAAKLLGRRFIGIDINPDFCELSKTRVSQARFGEKEDANQIARAIQEKIPFVNSGISRKSEKNEKS